MNDYIEFNAHADAPVTQQSDPPQVSHN